MYLKWSYSRCTGETSVIRQPQHWRKTYDERLIGCLQIGYISNLTARSLHCTAIDPTGDAPRVPRTKFALDGIAHPTKMMLKLWVIEDVFAMLLVLCLCCCRCGLHTGPPPPRD